MGVKVRRLDSRRSQALELRTRFSLNFILPESAAKGSQSKAAQLLTKIAAVVRALMQETGNTFRRKNWPAVNQDEVAPHTEISGGGR